MAIGWRAAEIILEDSNSAAAARRGNESTQKTLSPTKP
jgi:hypothetical protein